MPDALPFELAPRDIKQRIDSGEPLRLIDVREDYEFAEARIDGAALIPLNTVPANLQSIEAKADEALLVVYCHHGVRSLNVVNWLRGQGVENVVSMAGGIDRWSAEVDASVPRYY